MTEQEINIAIARERGFTVAFRGEEHWMPFELKSAEGKVVKCTNSEDMAWKCVPDYTTDLNAMYEVEKNFTRKECRQYNVTLCRIVIPLDHLLPPYTSEEYPAYQYLFNAAAHQRAEAYLRVKGKWVD